MAIAASPAVAQMSAGGPPSSSSVSFPEGWVDGLSDEPVGAPPLVDDSRSVYAAPLAADTADEPPPDLAPVPRSDPAIDLASHTADAASPAAGAQDHRRLAPRDENRADRTRGADRFASPSQLIPDIGLRFDSIYTTITALVFVLGLFFLFMWLLRRGGRKRATVLPGEVVSVVGRVALAPKQFAQLLRVGGKLVLVALTPDGAEPITEVTDPAEVDRLLGLCQQYDPHSTSRAFEQVFHELARDRAAAGFLGDEASLADAADGRTPGGGARG